MSSDCEEITQVDIFEKTVKNSNRWRDLVTCLYKLFYTDYVSRIMTTMTIPGVARDDVEDLAKDSFENGIEKLLSWTKERGLRDEGIPLSKILFAFGKWQFMALRTKTLRRRFNLINKMAMAPDTSDSTLAKTMAEERPYWDHVSKIVLHEEEYLLHLAIRELKEEWQQLIHWYLFDKLRPDAIAKLLHVTEGHVRNMLTAAKRALKKILMTKFNFGANGTLIK